jgi:acetylornithine deacetylase
VLLALVADEEHGSLGTTAVLDRLAATRGAGAGGRGDTGARGDAEGGRWPAACIVAEPTWMELASAHRGFAVIEVEVRGRAAHSSRPQDGVNAVTHLGRLLAGVEARDAQLRETTTIAGQPSLMATVVRGGTAPFVLPDRATATIERRTVPGEPIDVGLEEVEQLLRGLDATASQTMAREAWQLDEGDPAVARIVGLLGDPPRTGFPYWMESALWEAAGIPAVVIGPAGGGLHTDVEWVELPQLLAYTETLTRLIPAFSA